MKNLKNKLNPLSRIIKKSSDMVMYGANLIVRKYSNFPQWLPLPCHLEHGWTAMDESLISDLEVDKGLMLVYSQRRYDSWKKVSKIPVEIIGSPFVQYRRLEKIKVDLDAKGTIVFPSHSTNELDVEFDIDKFCRQLDDLPKDFQPVTICLHFIDLNKGRDKEYLKRGFNVVSAGSMHNLEFVNNFYNIIKKHKYSCSNEIGSYSFYCVEMGIPFFLIGDTPKVINSGQDRNAPKESKIIDWKVGEYATKIFSTGPVISISAEQENFVCSEMGVNDSIKPEILNKKLWKNFWLKGYYFILPIFYLINLFRKIRRIS